MRAFLHWLISALLVCASAPPVKAEEGDLASRLCELSGEELRARAAGETVPDFTAERAAIYDALKQRIEIGLLTSDPDYLASKDAQFVGAPLLRVQPRYPPEALASETSGALYMMAKFNRLGEIEMVYVLAADPRGVFEDAAIEALLKWTYHVGENATEHQFQFVPVQLNFCINQATGTPVPVPVPPHPVSPSPPPAPSPAN